MKPSTFPIYFAHDYRYHQMKTIAYYRKNFMQVCGCVYMCVCVYVYLYICVHYSRLVIKYHQLTLQANNYINLWLHNYKQKKHLQWWAVEPEQKRLYWNPWNSRSYNQMMSPTIWETIFIWFSYLQLQNAKLNLLNFTVTSPFNRESNYTFIGRYSSLELTNKTKK